MVIAITIPAYRAAKYIEDCLDSIDRLEIPEGIEILPLIAVDGCHETAEAIGGGYYWSSENVGPYVLRNSLMALHDADYYLSFCADDVLLPGAVVDLLEYAQGYDIIKPMGQNVDESISTKIDSPYHMGVLMMNRKAYHALGGYRQCRIYSDTDLWNRAGDLGLARIKTNSVAYYRRIHPGQITKSKDGLNSKVHKDAKARSRKLRKRGDLCIKPRTIVLEER